MYCSGEMILVILKTREKEIFIILFRGNDIDYIEIKTDGDIPCIVQGKMILIILRSRQIEIFLVLFRGNDIGYIENKTEGDIHYIVQGK